MVKRDSFNTFVERCKRIHKAQPSLRYGQIIFNEFSEARPVLAEEMRGSMVDPFYCSDNDSTRHTVALEWIKERWE